MYERVESARAKTAYSAALSAMQPDLPVIQERGKITIHKKDKPGEIQQETPYARWDDINQAIRPVLGKHGFAISFRTGLASDGKITVTGILSHAGGHQEETTMTLPHDSTGSKNAVQAVGSSTSYGKRYVAMALLNLSSTRSEDDDGRAGGHAEPELPDSVRAYLDLAAEKIAASQTAKELSDWWSEQKEQRIALDLVNTLQGPRPGYQQLFGAYSRRGKELSR
ncbi:MAG: ERF family protein [Methylocella sp.]